MCTDVGTRCQGQTCGADCRRFKQIKCDFLTISKSYDWLSNNFDLYLLAFVLILNIGEQFINY